MAPPPRWTLLAAVPLASLVLWSGTLRTRYLDPDAALLGLVSAVIVALLGWLLLARCCGRLTGYALALLLFGLVASTIGALDQRLAVEHAGWLVVGLGWFALGQSAGGSEARSGLVWALVLVAGAVGLLACAQWLGVTSVVAAHRTETGHLRVTGPFLHPNNLAGFVALLLPLAVAVASGPELPRPWRLLAAGSGVMLVGAVLGSYSRGGQAALLVALATCLLALAWPLVARQPRRRRLVTVVLGGVGLAVTMTALLLSPAGARLRLLGSLLQELPRFRRWGTWQAAATVAGDHPWLGVGSGCFGLAFPAAKPAASHSELYTHAHNWYLQTAAEQGLPWLIGLLLVLATAFAVGLARWRRDRDRVALGLSCGVLGFALAGVVDYNLGSPAVALPFWLCGGLLVAADSERPGLPAPRYRLVAGGGLLLTVMAALVMLAWNRAQVDYLRCCGLWQRGDLVGAAAALEDARRLDPGLLAYELVRADLAKAAGRPDRELAVLSQLDAQRRLLPSHWLARLAWLEWGAGEHAAAEAVMARAVTADPAEPVLAVDLGLMRLASGAPAEPLFRSALARDVDAAGAAVGLGHLAAGQGDHPTAVEWYRRAAAVHDPRDRVPRLLAMWGRIDPWSLELGQPPRYGGDRVRYHGALAPWLRAWMAAAAVSRQPDPPAPDEVR